MFIPKFLHNLPQPLGNTPSSTNLINKKFKHNFINSVIPIGIPRAQKNKWFNPFKKISPRDDLNVEDDPYETPIFVNNKEMDQLVVAHHYTKMRPIFL
jgi:hypothetical protein